MTAHGLHDYERGRHTGCTTTRGYDEGGTLAAQLRGTTMMVTAHQSSDYGDFDDAGERADRLLGGGGAYR